MAEINTLKQDRDLYLDRYQKIMKDSMLERQKVERRMQHNSFQNSNDVLNMLKQFQIFTNDTNQIDSSSQNDGQINSARNQYSSLIDKDEQVPQTASEL